MIQPLASVITCPVTEHGRKQHADSSQAVPSAQAVVYTQHCPIIVVTMCDVLKLAIPMVQSLAFTTRDPMKQDCVVVVACQAVPKCTAVSACSMLPNGGSYCDREQIVHMDRLMDSQRLISSHRSVRITETASFVTHVDRDSSLLLCTSGLSCR